ncbi:MAG: OsmC family protein [bacterium]
MSDLPVATDTPVRRPPNVIHATWLGDHVFDTGRVGGPQARIDGSAQSGQSPPDVLLSALATCSGIDVIDILGKRRTPVESLTVEVAGDRRSEMPRRFEHLVLTFRVNGAGIDRVHAERAVQLAFEKYCSVAATLAPDIVAETVVVLNGAPGESIRQQIFAAGPG